MVTLKFGHTNKIVGFPSFETANYNDVPPARIVRELIQNSLDAGVEAGVPTTIVRFLVDKIGRNDMPDINGFQQSFQSAIDYQTEFSDGNLPDAAQEVVNRIRGGLKALGEGKGLLLSVTDNGVGLDKRRMNSLLSDGVSSKSFGGSGSYGIGHTSAMALSDIRFMLYGGLTNDGESIVCGRTILATHPNSHGDRLNAPEGYLIRKFKDGSSDSPYEFLPPQSHPEIVRRHIERIREEWGHGCAVLIPAFNRFRVKRTKLWDIVSRVAAYNFCPAIQYRKLVIEVGEGESIQKLDADSLEDILEREQERTRTERTLKLRLSGQNAYSILKTITSDASHQVKVNGDIAHINLLVPSISGYPRIDLFRNGMWITHDIPGLRRTDFADLQPFHAVIEFNAKEGGQLHRLIRKAEGPMHDKISLNLLSGPEEDLLRKSLGKIAQWIREKVPPTENEEYTVDDFLIVNTSTDGRQGEEEFSFWGTPTPMLPGRNRSQVSTGSQIRELDIENEKKRRQKRKRKRKRNERRSRPLPFRSVLAPDKSGKLIGSIYSESDFQEVWLMLRIDENTDPTCDRIGPDENVIIKSFYIHELNGNVTQPESELIPEGKGVKILGISADAHYEVQVEYETPQELQGVVESPVLRLELRVPSNSETEK